jgi:acyl carrier protein
MDAPVAPAETSGAPRSREDVVAARVLELTAQLARELRPNLSVARIVSLDSDLERDLAFDSLARAELVLRLDRAFKIRLPDHLIGSAETPRDLAKPSSRRSPLSISAATALSIATCCGGTCRSRSKRQL